MNGLCKTALTLFLLVHAADAQCPDRLVTICQGSCTQTSRYNFVETDEDIRSFYGGGDTVMYGDVVPAAADRSMIFIHRDNQTCAMNLVAVHDLALTGNTSGSAVMTFPGDIAGDITIAYDNLNSHSYDSTTRLTTASWKWPALGSAGFAYTLSSDFVDQNACIDVTPVSFQGINTWVWAYPDKSSASKYSYSNLAMNQRLTICSAQTSNVVPKMKLRCTAVSSEPPHLNLRCTVKQ